MCVQLSLMRYYNYIHISRDYTQLHKIVGRIETNKHCVREKKLTIGKMRINWTQIFCPSEEGNSDAAGVNNWTNESGIN